MPFFYKISRAYACFKDNAIVNNTQRNTKKIWWKMRKTEKI